MRTLIIILVSLLIASCSWLRPYQPDLQQGNIITDKMTDQLHKGMSRTSVLKIMGNPVLENTFSNIQTVYVYTLKPNKGELVKKEVILTFRRGKLTDIEKVFSPKDKH